MANYFKAVIVGGGASGLLCAVELLRCQKSLKGNQIAIIEKNDRVGKKLIATGNGQGNLCNQDLSKKYYHGNSFFIKSFFDGAKSINIQEYLTTLGIPLTTAKDGKQYPISKQASAVLDVIRAFLESKGCTIITGETVTKVDGKEGDFTVITDKNQYNAQKIVLAFGGKAGKQFGTDGSSYILAQNLGHEITSLYPSLVQLKTETDKIKGLKGLKENANVFALDGDKLLSQSAGEVLFTEYGVSGNAIFQVSGYLTNAKKPRLKIEFLPEYTLEQARGLIEERQKLNYLTEEQTLVGILNKRIGQAVIKTAKSTKAKDVTYAIKNFDLNVTGNLGFNYAQVTKGGVNANQVNPYTLESLKRKGVYIIGEALDVDGDCGGYNLAFAFESGIICAQDIKEKVGKEN